jgi:uncharacterized protein YoxC
MSSSALPIDSWFHIKPEEYASVASGSEDAFKKQQFAKRVGYLGGYSLGLTEGLSSLDRLYESDQELFKNFYSEVARFRPSVIPIEVLIEYLSNISQKNASTDFGPLPKVSAGDLVPKKVLAKVSPTPPSNGISFSRNYQETFLKPDTGTDAAGSAVPLTTGVDETWSYFKKILTASGSGNLRPELDEACFDFRELFRLVPITVTDTSSPTGTRTEQVWVGNDAVALTSGDLSEWEKWFSIGSVEGKTQAIITNALRFVRLTLEKVEAVQPQSNVGEIDGFDQIIIDDIQAKISSILTAAGSATDAEASILRGELLKIIQSIQKYSSLVSSEPANNDIKLSLDIDLNVARGLIERFGDTLTSSSPIFSLFGRKLFSVLVEESGVKYTFQFASPFISANSDRSNFTTEEQDAVNEASSFLGGAFADFNDQNYRDSYVYKSLLVEPQEDPDTKKFLDSLLPKNKKGATASIVIESVKEAVEILNPAYVAGICAAYAVSMSWEGNKAAFLNDAVGRNQFRGDVEERIDRLIESQTASLIQLGGISTPLQSFNISYVMGLRSLRYFADFVADKAAMLSGAQLVISRLRTQLPQFFTDFDDINDIASALAYVDRGALAIYTRLKEQDAKISELNSVVASLTSQVQDLTVKLDAAQTKIQIQDNTIQSLNSELEKLKAAYSTLSSLSKSIQDDLEKELDNARKEIKELVKIRDLLKDNLELTKKRLEESQSLVEEWKKAAISAQGALQAVEVLAYATTGFLIGGPVGAGVGAFFGEDIVNAVSQGKSSVKSGLNSAAKKIKSWF